MGIYFKRFQADWTGHPKTFLEKKCNKKALLKSAQKNFLEKSSTKIQ